MASSFPSRQDQGSMSAAAAGNMQDSLNRCDYHDYSLEGESESLTILSKEKNGSESNFPVKLHYMLSDMEADGLDHIVSWQPHGRSFTVNNPKEFVEKILPLWFRQSKLSSFQRQLNLYGFKRITQGRDKGAHYHELFLRGKRHLAHRIPRMKIKGGGPRKSARPAEEPNFYQMPYLPPHQKVKKNPQAVYQMHMPADAAADAATTPTMNDVVQAQNMNHVLEQALAHHAYLNYTSQTTARAATRVPTTTTFAPLPSPPPLPSPAAAGLSPFSQALGAYAGMTDEAQLLAAMREKEMLTVALLQRLRSRR